MEYGTITLNSSIEFHTPGSGVGECEGDTEITGDFNTSTSTMTSSISIEAPFTAPPILGGGTHLLVATGSSSNAANWNQGTGVWGSTTALSIPIDFAIYDFTEEGCVADENPFCEGDLVMAFLGEENLPNTVHVNGLTTTNIDVPFSCGFTWFFALDGGTIDIGVNDQGSPPVGNTGEAGARSSRCDHLIRIRPARVSSSQPTAVPALSPWVPALPRSPSP